MLSHRALRAFLGHLPTPGDCAEPVRPLGHYAAVVRDSSGRISDDGRPVPHLLRIVEVWHCPACDVVLESIGPVPVAPEYRYSTSARPKHRKGGS